jgi:hypothetical protein
LIEVLYFSQKDVRDRLMTRVRESRGLLLVVGVRHSKTMKPLAEREPFASLDSWFGEVLDQIIVADDGTVDGMWRDPLGEDRPPPRQSEPGRTTSRGTASTAVDLRARAGAAVAGRGDRRHGGPVRPSFRYCWRQNPAAVAEGLGYGDGIASGAREPAPWKAPPRGASACAGLSLRARA